MPAGDEKKQGDDELFGAILAFEQILEAMPDDHTSLETLWHAYEQIGDLSKARDYMLRLANVICSEQDAVAAKDILAAIREAVGDNSDDESAELIAKLEELSTDSATEVMPQDDEQTGADEEGKEKESAPVVEMSGKKKEALQRGFSIADELSFAWNLLEKNELSQDEYSAVVQDLTEMSASDSSATVSVLHVLEARAFKNLERIMGLVSKECGTPIVSLDCFDLQLETVRLLPLEFMQRRGALAFESLGKVALVVVLNAYDRQLKTDVETLAGVPCNFFMALPSDFDLALSKVVVMLDEAAKAEALVE